MISLRAPLIFILFFAFLVVPFLVYAQVALPTDSSTDTLTITTNPEYPRPFSVAEIRIQSFSVDLNQLTISWFLNGTLQKEGVGERTFLFQTGGIGEKATVRIVARSSIGVIADEVVEITPASVDLIWQGRTYTPPFYRGRSVVSAEALVDIVAFPQIILNNRFLQDDEVTYTWKKDGEVLGEYSGYGKNTLLIQAPFQGSATTIEVLATAGGGAVNAEGVAVIEPIEPFIRVYENDPLLGVQFHKAITGTLIPTSNDVTVTAYPFFFSVENRNSSALSYEWLANDTPIDSLGNDRGSINIAVDDGQVGVADLSLSIQNAVRIFQAAAAAFSITFGSETNL
ncbi:hypothetical protein COU17_03650 [Candidatus Kaiserbacteria bacterium CG10_big_fil_rev_8_21_14_0_10_49_17]|uniref:Uncharacterized protein n=1 Tax=Candidatus Kaiserbacteria bacterium CG10_big_fil_rev_8_21_14_0_10_49_17 TaxID=1974609 RepID=A0A2M6WDI9_9BACT|nr:MAG: hypothetical protein COU17_03650 [Candidatus Kaiserbacteria bacterium CG10_big_fil_rev_8_21_14_0_10_49_17]